MLARAGGCRQAFTPCTRPRFRVSCRIIPGCVASKKIFDVFLKKESVVLSCEIQHLLPAKADELLCGISEDRPAHELGVCCAARSAGDGTFRFLRAFLFLPCGFY
jgi:hypothetical protein